MGMNIAKAINSEITMMLSHANVLNQAALDTIMKQLHAIHHTKETPKSPDTNYSMTISEDHVRVLYSAGQGSHSEYAGVAFYIG